jgi:hypothetical protein
MKYWINAITQEWGTVNDMERPGSSFSDHDCDRAGRGAARLRELELAGFAVMDREEFDSVLRALGRKGVALARAPLSPDFPIQRFLQESPRQSARFELCFVS